MHARRSDRRRRQRAAADADGECRGQRARERHQHRDGLGRRRDQHGNNTATDPTTIVGGPDLTITKTHAGSFTQGQTGATYTITVSNAGGAPTSGTVTVTDTLPAGLTATGLTWVGLDLYVGDADVHAQRRARSPAPAIRR